MRLSYGEWVVIGLSVIMSVISALVGGVMNPGGILATLVISLAVFYLSYRIILRYYPRSGTWGLVQWTVTIFLLGIVLLVIGAVVAGIMVTLLFGGMLLSPGGLIIPQGHGAEPPAVEPTAASRPSYARFGITFQYPGERSVQELAASETSGRLLIGPPQEQLSVTWTSAGGVPPDLDAAMLASLGKDTSLADITEFHVGETEKGSQLGHTATFVPVSYLNAGIPYHGGMIWWYCPQSDRIIALRVDTLFSQEYARSTLQDVVRSFTCHT